MGRWYLAEARAAPLFWSWFIFVVVQGLSPKNEGASRHLVVKIFRHVQ
jgi:hypothetical protein